MPSPNATIRTNPNAGRPAAIEPSRIRSALVEGIRPPASPRAKSPRQVIVVPAAGRWLCRTPPWLCSFGSRALVRVVVVLVLVLVVVFVRLGVGTLVRSSRATATDLPDQHPAADEDDGARGKDRRGPDHHIGRQEPLGADDHRRQGQDAERVRDRDRQTETDGVEWRAAGADQVGGHQRLAVAGREGMPGAECEGREDRCQEDERREVGRSQDRWQIAGQHPTRDRRLRVLGRFDGECRDRDGRGLRRRLHRDRDARGCRGEGDGPVIERLAEQVRRVRRQTSRPGRRPERRAVEGYPRSIRDDLAPADPLRIGTVRERDRRGGRQGRRQSRGVRALEPHRGQAAGAGREGESGGADRQRHPVIGDTQVERPGQRRARGRLRDVRLGGGDGAVAIGVDGLLGLEGGDLGLVDDDVEGDAVRRDHDARVVVDREIAERMRRGQPGKDQQHGGCCQGGEDRSAVRSSAAWSSHRGVGTRAGPRRMNWSGREDVVGYTPAVTRPGDPVRRGWFITIEGPEGAGKTTQAGRLLAGLEARGHDVLSTREPGGTWLGERLRELLLARTGTATRVDPLTDALLFNAARRQLVVEVIEPALAAGRIVLCARFADSTLAYQGFGAGASMERLRALEEAATDGLKPDLTILLDLPVEAGLARKAPEDVTRFEADFDVAFHRRVRDGFLALAAAEPSRFTVVDATADADQVERCDRRCGRRPAQR